MNQSAVIPRIVRLSKILALTIDNYFINYEKIKKNTCFYDYERLQIKIHRLRDQLIKGFSWYCGSAIELEEKKLASDFIYSENEDPFMQEHELLLKALEQSKTISKGIVASYDYKQLFSEIKNTCEAQLKITTDIIQKTKKKYDTSHFVPKYIKRRETTIA